MGNALVPSPKMRICDGSRLRYGESGSELSMLACKTLAETAPAAMFPHIPFPIHIDDWQARQTFDSFCSLAR